MADDRGLDFEVWYRREHPRLYRSMLAVGADRVTAREVTDEAFCRALARWRQVQSMASPVVLAVILPEAHLTNVVGARSRRVTWPQHGHA